MTEETKRDILRIVSILAHEASIASYTSVYKKLREFLDSPRPGDYIVEQSTVARIQDSSAIGRLIVCRDEFFPYDEEPGGYMDRVWHMEDVDGTYRTWRNAEFVRLPTTFIRDASLEPKEPGDVSWAALAMQRHEIPAEAPKEMA